MSKKNFNEVLKEREAKNELHKEDKMTLDSTERIKVLSPGQLVFKRFINNRLAIVGSVVLIFMFVFSFLVFPNALCYKNSFYIASTNG